MAHEKILFHLTQDEDGYPPADSEGVWADATDRGTYIVDNIPFYTTQATNGDEIVAVLIDGILTYESTLRKSGNSLLRIVFFNDTDPSSIRRELLTIGCESEGSHLKSLISVNVPAHVPLMQVVQKLTPGVSAGLWDYEEAILRQ